MIVAFCQIRVKGIYQFVFLNFEALTIWFTCLRRVTERDIFRSTVFTNVESRPWIKYEKEILQIRYLYSLDRIIIQKILVHSLSVNRKKIRRGTIFDRTHTLSILRFDYNFSGNRSICCHQLHFRYDQKQNHAVTKNEASRRYWCGKSCYMAHSLKSLEFCAIL